MKKEELKVMSSCEKAENNGLDLPMLEEEIVKDLEDLDGDKADEVLHYLFEAHSDLESLVYSLETEWEDPKNKEMYGKILETIKPIYEKIDDMKNNILDFI